MSVRRGGGGLHVSGWRVGVGLWLAGQALLAQAPVGSTAGRQRVRPVQTRDSKEGCPAVAPPVAHGSVATAVDFVELRRTGCASGCAAYTVRIGGDGGVSWTGVSGVEVTGTAEGSVTADEARALMQRIADRGFWRLCGQYVHAPSDGASFVTQLSIAGTVKVVEDVGQAAPSWVREEDLDIDRVADTHRWRHGGPLQETFGNERLVEDVVMPKVGVTQLMRAAAERVGTEELARVLPLLTEVNARDSSGWTALMYAAQAGTREGMQMLLRAGALAEARSNDGETALFAAVTASSGAEAKIGLLQALGVEMNARDQHGVTPLMIAARGYWRRPQVIAVLLQAGADASKRDDRGRTALDYLEAEARVRPAASAEMARGLLERR